MSASDSHEAKLNSLIQSEVLSLFEETFVKHLGIYTNKGTSFMETLSEINAELASKTFPKMPETIAGHVYHTRFYIRVLIEYMTGINRNRIDWQKSWVVTTVTASEWENLKAELLAEYGQAYDLVKSTQDWTKEDYIGGVLAIIAHCAYHLGAVRQLKEF